MSERMAILADIHGNATALRAVLEKVDEVGCAQVFCLGDIVGYGARPGDCLDLLRGRGARCLIGNHEALVLSLSAAFKYNALAIAAGDYTRQALQQEDLDRLRALPEKIHLFRDVLLVHGAPRERDQYLTNEVDFELAQQEMEQDEVRLCFFGHTHRAEFFDGRAPRLKEGRERQIDPQRITLINPGSVGQPRDGNPAAAFLWWSPDSGRVVFERVAYDVELARREIIDAGLPPVLGDRLRNGR